MTLLSMPQGQEVVTGSEIGYLISSHLQQFPNQTAMEFLTSLGGEEAWYEVIAARDRVKIGIPVDDVTLGLNGIWRALKERDSQRQHESPGSTSPFAAA